MVPAAGAGTVVVGFSADGRGTVGCADAAVGATYGADGGAAGEPDGGATGGLVRAGEPSVASRLSR